MKLNRPDINYNSPEWAKVEEWLAEELLVTYRRLANPATTAQETEQLRGRASLISQMLDFKSQLAVKSGRPL